MADQLSRLARHTISRLRALGIPPPPASVVHALLESAYLASLRTEESRFVQGSLTFADPRRPDRDPPITRRADYPGFTSFGSPIPLSVEAIVKLSRAIDKWSGAIAVYGKTKTGLVAWGVVDQLVHHNVRMNREAPGGAPCPGILTITMDGVAELSVHHADFYIGSLRQSKVVTRQHDALRSKTVVSHVADELGPTASQIARALGTPKDFTTPLRALFKKWVDALTRACISLRRTGTGGAFLVSPHPHWRLLQVHNRFSYSRLRDAVALSVLEELYVQKTCDRFYKHKAPLIPQDIVYERLFAEADFKDREDEITGAIKLVASLAAVDGIVLMSPTLELSGFGVKIRSGMSVGSVYDGPEHERKGARARKVDPSRLGTRHNSLLRYCKADRNAFALVVSQDGNVRLIASSARSLTIWNDVKLLCDEIDTQGYAQYLRSRKRYRYRHRNESTLGYTDMPKTFQELMRSRAR